MMVIRKICVLVVLKFYCLFCPRHHKKALRGVAYHKHYPLFASGADDGSVIVCHGMVYK